MENATKINDMLNDNEIKVLRALEEGHANAGGDFTYIDEIECNLSLNQLKGYLSQLQTKKYIIICNESNQVNFLEKSLEVIPNLEDTCNIY